MNGVTCPRCKRWTTGWPLKRADVCSPADWVDCIREPSVIVNQEAKRVKLEIKRTQLRLPL